MADGCSFLVNVRDFCGVVLPNANSKEPYANRIFAIKLLKRAIYLLKRAIYLLKRAIYLLKSAIRVYSKET